MSFWRTLARGAAGALGGQGIAGRAADAMLGESSHPVMRAAQNLNRSEEPSSQEDRQRRGRRPGEEFTSDRESFKDRMARRRARRMAGRSMSR